MKNRGAAVDDAATSILAGSQWGGDLVLSVGAWWPAGGAAAFYHITCRTPAAALAFPVGQVGMISSDGRCTQNPRRGATPTLSA